MRNNGKRNRKAVRDTPVLPTTGGVLNELSDDLLHKSVRLEMNGNHEAIVEGCSGVLEYNEYSVKLNTARHILCFTGTDLLIQCMTATGAVICGKIHSVQFLN